MTWIDAWFDFEDEDGGSAGLAQFTCLCGEKVLPPYSKHFNIKYVSNGDIVSCPKCNQQYRCVWYGMQLEKIE